MPTTTSTGSNSLVRTIRIPRTAGDELAGLAKQMHISKETVANELLRRYEIPDQPDLLQARLFVDFLTALHASKLSHRIQSLSHALDLETASVDIKKEHQPVFNKCRDQLAEVEQRLTRVIEILQGHAKAITPKDKQTAELLSAAREWQINPPAPDSALKAQLEYLSALGLLP